MLCGRALVLRGCPVVRRRAELLRSGPLLRPEVLPREALLPSSPLLPAHLLCPELLRSDLCRCSFVRSCPVVRCRAELLRSGPELLCAEVLPREALLPSSPLLPAHLLRSGL